MPLRLHAWTVFVGSALVCAFLGAIAPDFCRQEARFAEVRVDGLHCLVDEASDTFAAGTESVLPCLAEPPRRVILASGAPFAGRP